MKKILGILIMYGVVAVAGFGVIASCSKKSETVKKDSFKKEWIALFNGEDLLNWVLMEGKQKYTVKNGVIIGTTVPNGGNGILATKKSYSDFILKLDVKIDTTLNSGIQIRSHRKKIDGKRVVYGYQVEVDPSKRAWSGGIYDSRRRGWLVPLKNKPQTRKAFKNGKWNHYRIKASGDTIKTWVNGIHTATLVDSVDSSGFIGLQVHQRKKGGRKVKFKNIYLKRLR